MTLEMSKATNRRYNIGEFHSKYFKGHGIDIGCGKDSLSNHAKFFPAIESIRSWDLPDGDAQYMQSVDDSTFDFAVSSHCLEHMVYPGTAISNWLRILKPGGYLIFTVPDEDLYEMGVFPSMFNCDHKHTFTICKSSSWSPRSINIFDLLKNFDIQVIKIELLQNLYDFDKQKEHIDQTMVNSGPECAIEIILRKL